MADEIRITGMDELKRTLREYPKRLQKKALNQSLRKGAKIVQRAAKDNAPRDQGLLKRSIVVRQAKARYLGRDAARVRIGVLSRRKGRQGEKEASAFYWRFLEFGTSKLTARPFLLPAFESHKREVLNAITRELRNAIGRLADEARR